MAQILIIGNKGQYNHRILRSLRYLNVTALLINNSVDVEDVGGQGAKGIIIGGGPSIEESGNSLAIIERYVGELPILGICLGHQLLASVFGGDVKTAEVGGYAEEEISVEREDGILKGMFPGFSAWVSHRDEVATLPEGFVRLAYSKTCSIEAMANEERNLYGVQFHPEVEHTPRGKEIFKNFLEVCELRS